MTERLRDRVIEGRGAVGDRVGSESSDGCPHSVDMTTVYNRTVVRSYTHTLMQSCSHAVMHSYSHTLVCPNGHIVIAMHTVIRSCIHRSAEGSSNWLGLLGNGEGREVRSCVRKRDVMVDARVTCTTRTNVPRIARPVAECGSVACCQVFHPPFPADMRFLTVEYVLLKNQP